jgi:hypothetical protein
MYDQKKPIGYSYIFIPIWLLTSVGVPTLISSIAMRVSSCYYMKKQHTYREEIISVTSARRSVEQPIVWSINCVEQ